MFPTTDITEITTSSETTSLGKSFLFDFEKGDFVLVDGNLVETTETKALKIWIEKILKTEKNKYEIYDNENYGVKLDDLKGQVLPLEFAKSEILREVKEALLQHPHIFRVDNLTVEQIDSGLTIKFTVVLVDKTTLESEVTL
jgi:hypothetical protein